MLKTLQKKHEELEDYTPEELSDTVYEPRVFFALTQQRQPFEYQNEILKIQDKDVIILAGRQVGKSTLTAVYTLHHVLTRDRRCALIISPSQRQSNLMFKTIRNMISSCEWLEAEVLSNSATCIEFKNGSTIYSLPAPNEGTTIRGFSPTLIVLEEAAHIKEGVIDAITPMRIATKAPLWMLSSPYGQRGFFYKAWNEHKTAVKIRIPTSANPLVTKEMLAQERTRMTESTYLQEYEAEFVSDEGGYIPRQLIIDAVEDTLLHDKTKDVYYMGLDCARQGRDETVYTIAAYDGHNYKIVELLSEEKSYMNEVTGRIKHLHSIWNFKKIFVDTQGLGAFTDFFRELPSIPLVNVPFTMQSKMRLYPNMKKLFEDKRIKIPRHEKLMQQTAEVQVKYLSNGMTFHHPDGGFDDWADSLALAVYNEADAPAQNYTQLSRGFTFPRPRTIW